ncbi:MAG TPA: DUF4437 domain-containing protein [Sphingomicrobium sp.]|nr:DUF4437 domain-containing protein [Sphingomicrobium sp.]
MKYSIRSICTMTAISLAAAANGATPGNHYLPADRIAWSSDPGAPVELGPLWGKRADGEAGTLLRTPPGFRAPLHSHTADYWAVVVQGTWEHWVPSTGEGKDIRLERGAHWTQVKAQWHGDACVSAEPCIIFLFNKEPYETHFRPEAKP